MVSELPTALTAALEAAFNRYLTLDPQGPVRMAALEGSVIGIALQDLDWRVYLLPGKDRVQVLGRYEHAADAVLHATPLALLRLAQGGDAARMMLSQELRIEGDVQLGQQFKSVLDQLDIDWEEHLSGLVGDVVAHQVGRGVKAGMQWSAAAVHSLEQDVVEYLQEETRLAPTAAELSAFMDEVDRLRADVDRLQARMQRLQGKLAASKTDAGASRD